jgi:hypothetical protein
MRVRSGVILAVTAGAGLLALSGFAGRADPAFETWVRMVAVGGAAVGVLVALAAWRLSALRLGTPMVLAILAVGLLARLLLFCAPHDLSEDAARYHWDGKVLASGVNPYLHPPDAPEVRHLRVHALDEAISERSDRTLTVYPPLAELAFAAGYLLTPGSLLGLKLLWLLAEVATWLLLLRELSRRRLPKSWILLAAWHPLLVFGGYLTGHADALLLPFVVLFMGAVRMDRPGRAGLWLALGALVKPWPLLLAPAAWRELGTRGTLRMLGVAAGTAALLYSPFLGAGENLVDSVFLMAREWSFNGSLSTLLEEVFRPEVAHYVSMGLLLAAVLAGLRVGRGFLARCLLAGAAFAAFMPTLFPWYLFWILPVLVLGPDPALVALSCLIPLADLVLPGYVLHGFWELPAWIVWGEYAVFYALLLLSARRRWGMFTGP